MTSRRITDAELVEIFALAHAQIRAGWWAGAKRMPEAGARVCLVQALAIAARHVLDAPYPLPTRVMDQIYGIIRDQMGNLNTWLPMWNDGQPNRRSVLALLERAARAVGK